MEELLNIKSILDRSKIPWALYAGSAAKIYGSKRELRDIDIIIPTTFKEELSRLLNKEFECRVIEYKRSIVNVKLIKYDNIEIATDIKIIIGSNEYIFDMDNSMLSRLIKHKLLGIDVPVISVEDNIVFKAILQRGKEDNKHDLEDIKDMIINNKIDLKYLIYRADIMNARYRVIKCLQYVLSMLI